ncbi:helix-turn-helix domain-containing protein [Bradyrhizobium sp. UFLA05-112]
MGDRTWTTTAAPGREIAYWREAVCDAVIELEIDVCDDRPFCASMSQSACGPIGFSKIEVGSSQTLRRSRSIIARSSRQQFELVYFSQCDAMLVHAGSEVGLRSEQCVLIDGSRPYSIPMKGPSRNVSIHIPSKWLAARIPNPDLAVARPVDCGSPIGVALVSLIHGMVQATEASNEFKSRLAEQILGVFQLALSPPESDRSPHSHRLYERVREALRDLSNDQELSASTLAEELGISVRYLHALFAQAGTSYGRELQGIRLETAMRMLADERFRRVSVNEIAFRAGYSEPSHFCRRFKEATGITPSSYRTTALS